MNPTCQHHWLIESPNGPTSDARCQRCGATRQFRNHHDDSYYNMTIVEREAANKTRREEAALAGIVAHLSGPTSGKRANDLYAPPVTYSGDRSEL